MDKNKVFGLRILKTWDQISYCVEGRNRAGKTHCWWFHHQAKPLQSLTFQHFHSNSERLVGLLLIDADSLCHHHLTEASLAQRFTQSQTGTKKQNHFKASVLAVRSSQALRFISLWITALNAKYSKDGAGGYSDLDVLTVFTAHHIRRTAQSLKHAAWQQESSHAYRL